LIRRKTCSYLGEGVLLLLSRGEDGSDLFSENLDIFLGSLDDILQRREIGGCASVTLDEGGLQNRHFRINYNVHALKLAGEKKSVR
jgi:hypothetical protein